MEHVYCASDWGDIASAVGVLFVFWTFAVLIPISFMKALDWRRRDDEPGEARSTEH